MFARALAFLATLLLATACTDGRAYAFAHASELKNPHLGIFTLDLNPFQEKSPLSPSATKEKTLEIAAASIGRGNYLRARYMDPSQGRFVGMDPFSGFGADPLSLHKYLYANGDPANRYDPSGYFSWTFTSISTLITSTTGRAFLMSAAKPLLKKVAKKLARAVAIAALRSAAKVLVEQLTEENESALPGIFFGTDVGEARDHYSTAIENFGSVLTYIRPGYPDQWYNRVGNTPCTGKTGGTEPDRDDCDEYPFKSAKEGGPINYGAGKVSLWPVYWEHNQAAGRKLGDFLNNICRIPPNEGLESTYFVATTIGPVTLPYCGSD